MSVIPVDYKNDDTEQRKSRTGKVTPVFARARNSYEIYSQRGIDGAYKKAGILKDYGQECTATHYETTGVSQITFGKGIVVVYGGYIYIEDGTMLDGDLPLTPNTSGYIGLRVNLNNSAGQEVKLIYSNDAPKKNNLIVNETGEYDFVLYNYAVGSDGSITTFEKTNEYCYGIEQVVEMLRQGEIVVKNTEIAQSVQFTTTPPTQSPPEGTLIICFIYGGNLPTSRYDRVLYLVW